VARPERRGDAGLSKGRVLVHADADAHEHAHSNKHSHPDKHTHADPDADAFADANAHDRTGRPRRG
jgi:hypothetical protein